MIVLKQKRPSFANNFFLDDVDVSGMLFSMSEPIEVQELCIYTREYGDLGGDNSFNHWFLFLKKEHNNIFASFQVYSIVF